MSNTSTPVQVSLTYEEIKEDRSKEINIRFKKNGNPIITVIRETITTQNGVVTSVEVTNAFEVTNAEIQASTKPNVINNLEEIVDILALTK
jgi:hypothetical protein